ncbi:hypothetical protein ABWH96_14965 [Marivirga tractuosa]|uniref:hypothetical protein n=1 Tax=Marivirga tractuosa TaxID=1006 RepID=UPI0035CF03DA
MEWFDLTIGQGTANSGDFSNIDWGNNSHFIQTSLDAAGGTEFETIALTQLMSVPYAVHSNSTGNFTGNNLEISGNGSNEDMITLKNDNYSRISAYAANDDFESVASFVGRRSGGTIDKPTNISPEQRISGVYGSSYLNNDYEVSTAIEFFSGKESGNNGSSSYIKFGTTGIGSTQRLERMRITENGNVGIGTSNPEYNLEVEGSLNANEIYLNGESLKINEINNRPIEVVGSGQNENMITLKNNNYSRIAAFSASDDFESVASFAGRRSGGTVDNPTNISPEQRISGLYGSSYLNNDYEVSTAIEFISGKESGSTGTSSYIKFGTTGIGSTQRLERMRIAENGNVGIGTNTPNYNLDVNGTLNVSEIYQNGELIDLNQEINEPIELVGSGQNENMITLRNDNYSRIAAYAANDDFESVASFVGRRSGGTVDNPTNISPEQRISGFYGSSYLNNEYEVSTAIEFISGKESGNTGTSSYIKFGTTGVGAIQRVERMRIAENGNVGIGTTIPKSKLQVTNGDIYIEDASSGVIMTSPDGNCWRMTVDNTGNPQFSSITCPE